jgi:hypothetical protein
MTSLQSKQEQTFDVLSPRNQVCDYYLYRHFNLYMRVFQIKCLHIAYTEIYVNKKNNSEVVIT